MKHKKMLSLAALLILLTAIFAIWHLTTREQIAQNQIQLIDGEKVYSIVLEDLAVQQVVGTRTNGKGEQIPVNAPGISVKDLLEQYAVAADQGLSITADDGYSATLKAEEIPADHAFLILEDDTARLVVFGDSNSKRSVSNVKQILVLP